MFRALDFLTFPPEAVWAWPGDENESSSSTHSSLTSTSSAQSTTLPAPGRFLQPYWSVYQYTSEIFCWEGSAHPLPPTAARLEPGDGASEPRSEGTRMRGSETRYSDARVGASFIVARLERSGLRRRREGVASWFSGCREECRRPSGKCRQPVLMGRAGIVSGGAGRRGCYPEPCAGRA
jgi:hypothetical protein